MEACDPNVFGIPAKTNVYRRGFHVNAPNAVYFDNKMNTIDKMYPAVERKSDKNRKIK